MLRSRLVELCTERRSIRLIKASGPLPARELLRLAPAWRARSGGDARACARDVKAQNVVRESGDALC